MCIFFTLCVQFSTGMQLFVSAEKLSSFVAQKLFGKIPSVLKGLLGMGVFGYRILHQSVAVTMQLIVEQVLIAIFLLLFFFLLAYKKPLKVVQRICNCSICFLLSLEFYGNMHTVCICFCEQECTTVHSILVCRRQEYTVFPTVPSHLITMTLKKFLPHTLLY